MWRLAAAFSHGTFGVSSVLNNTFAGFALHGKSPMRLIQIAGRSARGLAVGLGVGLLGAIGMSSILTTRAAPVQKEAPQKPDLKSAGGQYEAFSAALSGKNKPARTKVEKGPFKIEVVVNGVFEARRMTEVSIRPKSWAMPLQVERAIELGRPVKKGDILVEFVHDKIDKSIEDAVVENTIGELALKLAEEELPLVEKSLPVDLAAATRAKTQADEDLKRFFEIEKPDAERTAHFMVKQSSEYLEYAKEELRQLEKMYRSKDLTEETEEIILRRQRFQVDSREHYLKEALLQRDKKLSVDLPRQEERVRENAIKQAIDLEKTRSLSPLNLGQKRLTAAKLKHDYSKSVEKLADLRLDREAMVVHSPSDGLVYYGRCDSGHWPAAAAIAQKLQKGGIIAPDEVFITVVAVRPLDIRATVDEKDLLALTEPGMLKGHVTPAVDSEHRLPARLTSVLPIAREPGKFGAVFALDIGEEHSVIKPGMACSVKLVPYRKKDTLTVPATAVFEDDWADAISYYVFLAKPDSAGNYPRRPVKIGKSGGGKTEIVDGLAEGEEILASKP
jgi:multidrug efflux pump subunit AcrA (membrane-fusion protein)